MTVATILLADDDVLLLEVTREILEAQGYHVLTACDGLEAVQQYQRHQAEIVLAVFDVMMPNLTGPDAAAQISRMNSDLPFIFVTGHDSRGDVDSMSIPQHFHILHKPVDFDAFTQLVRDTINRGLLSSGL